jgi:methionyl-tRNA formyltransferase
MSPNVVVITAGEASSWIIVNALAQSFAATTVLREPPEPAVALIKRRIRRFGLINGLGQVATMALSKYGKRLLSRRITARIANEGLQTTPATGLGVFAIGNVNAPASLDAIIALNPDIVVLVGTRLLNRETLNAIPCPVVNYHAGITPAYRGQNGGYWALACGDSGNFGTTLHLVDKGVDTGDIIAQCRTTPQTGDTLLTYALTLAQASRTMVTDGISGYLAGTSKPVAPDGQSRLWFQPTIWAYIRTGLTKGVW